MALFFLTTPIIWDKHSMHMDQVLGANEISKLQKCVGMEELQEDASTNTGEVSTSTIKITLAESILCFDTTTNRNTVDE